MCELEDLTGIAQGLVALERAEVLAGRTLGMAVGVASGDVEAVADPRLLNEVGGDVDGRFVQEARNDVAQASWARERVRP
jgi:hypothetical protein